MRRTASWHYRTGREDGATRSGTSGSYRAAGRQHGLFGGATPDASGTQVVISLRRLNWIRDVDPLNNTITVEAGVILADIQARAEKEQRLFTLSLAAEGSCMIDSNLSTNAGVTAVLRYGNTRELRLGLEVVTPQGAIWDGLRGLRKDNTGYNLRDLYIGAEEGTLGIITAAAMKLHPAPVAHVTALAALASPQAALDFLATAQRYAGPLLTGFELMSDFSLHLVTTHFPQMRYPFSKKHGQTVLLELSDSESEEHGPRVVRTADGTCNGARTGRGRGRCGELVAVAGVLESARTYPARSGRAMEGLDIKHDIAVPISRIGPSKQPTRS